MPYGEGDYGQGDYGQGGLFSFVGHALSKVAHFAGGVIGGALGLTHPSIHITTSGSGGGPLIPYSGPMLSAGQGFAPPSHSFDIGGGLFKHYESPDSSSTSAGYGLFSSGSSGGGGGGKRGRYAPPGTPGYHQLRSGQHAGQWVRNRRMNVTNPRALRRSIRRGRGFLKLARQFVGHYQAKAPKGKSFLRTKKR